MAEGHFYHLGWVSETGSISMCPLSTNLRCPIFSASLDIWISLGKQYWYRNFTNKRGSNAVITIPSNNNQNNLLPATWKKALPNLWRCKGQCQKQCRIAKVINLICKEWKQRILMNLIFTCFFALFLHKMLFLGLELVISLAWQQLFPRLFS